MLKKSEFQNIINRFAPVLKRDINIINLAGIILASSDLSRIDQLHAGAKFCIKDEVELIITKETLHLYKGTKIGVNIPFYFQGQIIGILGITGPPKEIHSTAIILKELVEHIVNESENQRFKVLQQEALRSLIIELLNSNHRTDYVVLKNRAKLVGFPFDSTKVLILGEIIDDNTIQSGISVEIIKKRILNTIRHHLEPDDISLILYEQLFVIIIKWRGNMKGFLNKIVSAVDKRLNVDIRFIVGGTCENVTDYSKRFNAAKRVYQMHNILNLDKNLYFANQFELELLMSSLSNKHRQQYLETYSDIFKQLPNDKSLREVIETVKVYFEQNMNIGETASVLYVHRNTVGYRLNKLKEQLKLNISKPYECMKLYIAIMIFDQMHELKEGERILNDE